MKQLNELYRRYTGKDAEQVKLLTPAGSSRKYYRLSGGDGEVSLIGVAGTDSKENEAFIYLSRHFYEKGLPVPRVLAVSDDGMCYLESDLGDVSLFALKGDEGLLEKAVRTLARFHYEGSDGMDYTKCFPVDAFDRQSVMWDLNYFKYSYLNLTGLSYSEPHLEEAMRHLAERTEALLTPRDSGLMLRDFQSRNVMIKEGDPYVIDFQGARRGPLAYDVASFAWQAKAGFSPETRRRLVAQYVDSLSGLRETAPDFDRQVAEMALLRTLQVLGAYGFRGLVEKKGHFIQSIPFALANLRELLQADLLDSPKLRYLGSLLRDVAAKPPIEIIPAPSEGLTVRVSSFSYKKGLPIDPSGNGGGFVFDCRAMDNPGRYEEYRPLTGLDAPVIEFLEERGEIQVFLDECYALVDTAIGNYLKRGFTSLTVSFGCTGGRHRSVYSAQHMAEHVKAMFPEVNVILQHRERGISQVL